MYDIGMQVEGAGIERELTLARLERLMRLGAFEGSGLGLGERVRRLLRRRGAARAAAVEAPFAGTSLVAGSGKLAGR